MKSLHSRVVFRIGNLFGLAFGGEEYLNREKGRGDEVKAKEILGGMRRNYVGFR